MRVLVAPLNWGLGHATRCIPVIHYLVQQKHEVILASDGQALVLLKKEFPGLPFVELPQWKIHYHIKPFFLGMLWQLPKFLLAIIKERRKIKSISKEYEIDAIISDSRYGIYDNVIPSVFISHQINIQFPTLFHFLGRWFNQRHQHYISRFQQVWIPDVAKGIADKLSKIELPQVKHIGMISRFSRLTETSNQHHKILFLLSGPEPTRTQFEKIILNQIKNSDYDNFQFELVRGTNRKTQIKNIPLAISMHGVIDKIELETKIKQASLVVLRSGYTSVMDMLAIGKKVVFVPTPGQTEQEYLAKQLQEKYKALVVTQKDFRLDKILAEHDNIPLIKEDPSSFNQFSFFVDNWLQEVQTKLTNLRGHD